MKLGINALEFLGIFQEYQVTLWLIGNEQYHKTL